MGRIITSHIIALSLLTFCANPGLTRDSTSVDLTNFSLEELMEVEVVSLSRKSESIQGAAAAVFVITAEDIRRSGAHSIPEVLRLAPGLDVARINSSSWAITSRGFNSRFANKLQVLVDGRSIYSPMFSGVYWENSSVMLEDIERIEIIRGPGATMWGANAVNGVINIITQKPEADTPSSMVAAMAGNEDLFRGAGRLDGALGKTGAWRLSTQYQKHDSFIDEAGQDTHDGWDEILARVRWDQKMGERNNFTLTSHFYKGNMDRQYLNNTPEPPYSTIGSNELEFKTASFQAIWDRSMSETSGLKLGLYFTHFDRKEYLLTEVHNIVDLDFQYFFKAGENHSLIWGGTWRHNHDRMHGQPSISFNPDSIDEKVYSAFLQDDWTIVPDRLHLVLGGKWEHRKETGDQWQPNVRLAYTPNVITTWWGSIARAVRVPSRINSHVQMDMTMLPPDAMYPGSPVTSISMVGNQDMLPEELLAFEAGFRIKPSPKVSLDLALFINQYDNLRTLTMGSPQPHPVYGSPVIMIPMVVDNGPGGSTAGAELAANWQPTGQCRFQLAYTFWDFKNADVAPGESHGMERMATPKHQASLRGLFNPIRKWEADIWFRFTDDLMADPEEVKSWNELDLRLAWTPVPGFRVAAGGRNLLHENHQEFVYRSASPVPTFIEPSGYLEFQWNF